MSRRASLTAAADVANVEAPVSVKAYLMCAFAAFGGIFFGYDSGYINGVMGMKFFIHRFTGLPYLGPNATPEELAAFTLSSPHQSLIVSILSAGTFFGAIIAGDCADFFGRRTTVIGGCMLFLLGVVLQVASTSVGLLVAGRLVAGFGVGFVTAIIILYMSEIAPKKVRGTIVSGYQFFITVGLMVAACVDYGTENRMDSGSYRIPIGIQMLWAIILAVGLFLLPESPRYFVKKGNVEQAARMLSRLRGLPPGDKLIEAELAEIVANHQYEIQIIPQGSYISSWINCFRGGVWKANSNLRRTILGTSLQMMSQWTGVNFIFYYGTVFFKDLGTISNPFLLSMITTMVNVFTTPLAFWTIEKYGRRRLILVGAAGMLVCQLIVAIVGTINSKSQSAVSVMVAFICIYIFFFATTWGPACWTLTGEIFPIPIRARGVGLSTASNWLWNCIIATITPYMVGEKYGNLGAKVFFIWGGLCTCALVWGYFLVPETKGLSLEQIDRMMEEVTPRKSAGWKPRTTFASEVGMVQKDGSQEVMVVEVEKAA